MNQELKDFYENELDELEKHFLRSKIVDEIGEENYRALLTKALEIIENEEITDIQKTGC